MEGRLIPEPQRTYLLELLHALGKTAEDFVVAGAQAIKFIAPDARGTKDFDFLLDVLALRKDPLPLAPTLQALGYAPVPESRNFQFEKSIPNSTEKMRIEFMAPAEYKREKDFRVEIQEGIHARACMGGAIALHESDPHAISGRLPSGEEYEARIRVTQPHALVMLKLLALADRYANIRGPKEARHDREEAQTHSADIVAVVRAVADIPAFRNRFATAFRAEPELGIQVMRILSGFFRQTTSPGLIVYTEYLAANLPADRATADFLRRETELAERIVGQILPRPEFLALAAAIDDCTEFQKNAPFAEQYLSVLETARIPLTDGYALESLPDGAFGGAHAPGSTFTMSAREPLQKVPNAERLLLQGYLQAKVGALRSNASLAAKFPHTLGGTRYAN
jgi:hypothetical protein